MVSILKKYIINKLILRLDNVALSRKLDVNIGEFCRVLDDPYVVFGSEPWLINIGNHVTITQGVRFITHDGGVWVFRQEYKNIDVFGEIKVGNNVFIGFNALILPGVTIGDNVVIGAGSIVTKSIPDDSVVAGCPARILSSIDFYKNTCLEKAFFVRSLPIKEKKEIVLNGLAKVKGKSRLFK